MFDSILFDLDGTLTDSFDGIAGGVLYALGELGEQAPDKSELKCFVGPPLLESFTKRFCGDERKAAQAVEFYREYYNDRGWKENKVYDGVEHTLAALKAAGKKLYVATSKPEIMSVRIIEHFGLNKYFDYVAGASLDKSRAEKAQVIEYAIATCNIDKRTAVMVGDRHFDIDGAKAVGIKSIGVLYGYGDEAELKSAGADKIAHIPADIIKLVR